MSGQTALLLLNLVSWSAFAAAVSRRRWRRSGLAVGLLHMLLITPMSIAPLRALLEPDRFHLGLAWLQVSGRPAAIPATIIWAWGLFASLAAVTAVGPGRALRVVAVGDLLVAANFGTYITVQLLKEALRASTAQAGEITSLAGTGVGLILAMLLVVPFVLSARWAWAHAAPASAG